MNDFYKYTSVDKFYGSQLGTGGSQNSQYTNIPGMDYGEDGWIIFPFGRYMPDTKWSVPGPMYVANDGNSFPPKDVLLPNGDILLTSGKIIVKSTGKLSYNMSYLSDESEPGYPVELSEPIPEKYNVSANLTFPIISDKGSKLYENGDIEIADGSKFIRKYSWIVKPDGSKYFDLDVVNNANAVYPVHYNNSSQSSPKANNSSNFDTNSNANNKTNTRTNNDSGTGTKKKTNWSGILLVSTLVLTAIGAAVGKGNHSKNK